MSLIQEALKRQEMEAAGAGDAEKVESAGEEIPKEAPPPDSPAPAPEPSAESEPEPEASESADDVVLEKADKGSKSRVWVSVAGIAILLVLAVGAAIYLLSLAVSRKPVASEAAGEQEAVQVAAPVPDDAVAAPLVEVPKEPAAPAPGTEPEVREPEREAPPVKPAPAEAPAQASVPDVIASVAQVEPETPPPEIKKPVVKKAPEPVNLPPVEWPRLKLTAVLCGLGDDQDAARINGVMVPEGGQVEGVTIKDVQQEGVMLQIEHETRFLRMGASIY